MKFTGIAKVKLTDGSWVVRITDGDMELEPISKQEYILGAFQPDFDDLTESDWLPQCFNHK